MSCLRLLVSILVTGLASLPFAPAPALAASLFSQGGLFEDRAALVATPPAGTTHGTAGNRGSLFAGQQGGSLFAAVALRGPQGAMPSLPGGLSGPRVEALRQLIENAESRRDGYDAVQHGARIKPPKRPTDMTLAEIYRWIDDTPRQPHAIGRYQFIPKTLRRLVGKLDIPLSARFSPAVQDRLADILLIEAGYLAFTDGRMSRRDFMHNLARIWAGLPTSNGRSYYHGFAGNKASMTWARFEAEMRQIFPG